MDLVLNDMEELNEQELMMVDGGRFWRDFAVSIAVDVAKSAGKAAWDKAKETNNRDYRNECKNYTHPYRGKI